MKIRNAFNSLMNPDGLRWIIGIVRANDDSRVLCILPVQANEVFAIDRQNCAILADSEPQDFIVRRPFVGASAFLNADDIVSEAPKLLDDGKGKVLVGIEAGHR